MVVFSPPPSGKHLFQELLQGRGIHWKHEAPWGLRVTGTNAQSQEWLWKGCVECGRAVVPGLPNSPRGRV